MTSGTSMPCAVDLDPIRSIPVTPKPTSMMTREELAEVLGGCLRLTPRVTCSKCGRPTAPEDKRLLSQFSTLEKKEKNTNEY